MNFLLSVLVLCFCILALPTPGLNLNFLRSSKAKVKHYDDLLNKLVAKALNSKSTAEKDIYLAQIAEKKLKSAAAIEKRAAELRAKIANPSTSFEKKMFASKELKILNGKIPAPLVDYSREISQLDEQLIRILSQERTPELISQIKEISAKRVEMLKLQYESLAVKIRLSSFTELQRNSFMEDLVVIKDKLAQASEEDPVLRENLEEIMQYSKVWKALFEI